MRNSQYLWTHLNTTSEVQPGGSFVATKIEQHLERPALIFVIEKACLKTQE